MQPLPPIDTLELFPILHHRLITLLRDLQPDDWQRPTVCKGWSVKDIVAHIVDGNFRRIVLYRDTYFPPDGPVIDSYESLVAYLNQLNRDWVMATRRLSPAILINWLEQTGPQTYELFKQLSPFDKAVFSVAWAGEETSPNWFHIAREYTELWHHQQQIRLAVDQTDALMTAELYHPLLDTFIRALPHTYRHVTAPTNTLVKLIVSGTGGGDWYLLRQPDCWQLIRPVDSLPAATVTIDGQIAWRLFSKSFSATEALPYVHIEGDPALGRQVLTMLSVMA